MAVGLAEAGDKCCKWCGDPSVNNVFGPVLTLQLAADRPLS